MSALNVAANTSLPPDEDDGESCVCCYLEVEEVKREAQAAGKGGKDGEYAVMGCDRPMCHVVFCMSCILEYCNRKIDTRQPEPTCPCCTIPLDLAAIAAQAKRYDPNIPEPLHSPPPPPHAIYIPWIDRFEMHTPIQPMGPTQIAEFVVFIAQHAVVDRRMLEHASVQRWHIACCIYAWAERWKMTRYVVLGNYNEILSGDASLQLADVEADYTHADRNAVQPAIRPVEPQIPLFLTPLEIGKTPARTVDVDAWKEKVGKWKASSAAMRCINDIAGALSRAGFKHAKDACQRLLNIVCLGAETVARFMSLQHSAFDDFVLQLVHHPKLARVLSEISLVPFSEYFGSRMWSWVIKNTARLCDDLPTTGPMAELIGAFVPGHVIDAQHVLEQRIAYPVDAHVQGANGVREPIEEYFARHVEHANDHVRIRNQLMRDLPRFVLPVKTKYVVDVGNEALYLAAIQPRPAPQARLEPQHQPRTDVRHQAHLMLLPRSVKSAAAAGSTGAPYKTQRRNGALREAADPVRNAAKADRPPAPAPNPPAAPAPAAPAERPAVRPGAKCANVNTRGGRAGAAPQPHDIIDLTGDDTDEDAEDVERDIGDDDDEDWVDFAEPATPAGLRRAGGTAAPARARRDVFDAPPPFPRLPGARRTDRALLANNNAPTRRAPAAPLTPIQVNARGSGQGQGQVQGIEAIENPLDGDMRELPLDMLVTRMRAIQARFKEITAERDTHTGAQYEQHRHRVSRALAGGDTATGDAAQAGQAAAAAGSSRGAGATRATRAMRGVGL